MTLPGYISTMQEALFAKASSFLLGSMDMKFSWKSASKGFTLVELMIVIAIIGTLTGLVASNFVSAQAKARDARRKSDLTQIQRALELYYNDFGHYPDDSNGRIAGCGAAGASACTWGSDFTSGSTVYMDQIPDERTNGYNYVYYGDTSGGLRKYQLFARLENLQDPILDQNGDGTADQYSKSCGAANCNYAATSPNSNGSENL